MKKYLVMLLLGLGTAAWAQQAQRFPVDSMDVAVLKSAQFPQAELTGTGFSWLRILTLGWLDGAETFNMVQGVRIKDENNRFITHGALPQHSGKVVALRRNGAGDIMEIWILTPAEREAFERRAELLQQQQNR